MNEHYFAILRRLFLLRRIGNNDIILERILGPFTPTGELNKARKALEELRKFGFIISSKSAERIAINPKRYDDVVRLLNPETDAIIKSIKPFEDAIPQIYHKVPFMTTQGSHQVKGIIDTYSFHKKRSDPDYVVVFLISDNKKKNTIHLGSIYNINSLYRKAITRIDKKFGGSIFTKAMMNELGKDIVGNRQPPKALIDLMIYDGYIIPIDEKHFQRTTKPLPKAKNIQTILTENDIGIANVSIRDDKTKKGGQNI